MAIRFRTNTRKALEVILWFANKRDGIDFHSILKLLFFADKEHLNEYGRPIVGDTYKALQYGPVAQTTYDILQHNGLALEELGIDEGALPFTVKGGYRVHATRNANLQLLSESDLEALESAWDKYSSLDFGSRTDLSHRHPAYKNAEEAGRLSMRYEDFLEGDNATPEMIEDLEAAAPRMRI